MTITGAVYPEVAELLDLVDPANVAERKAREVRHMLRLGRLHRAPDRDAWIFTSKDARDNAVEFVVDCRDLTFASNLARPNKHVLRSAVAEVERIVCEAIDAEVAAALRGDSA